MWLAVEEEEWGMSKVGEAVGDRQGHLAGRSEEPKFTCHGGHWRALTTSDTV